MLFRSHFRPHPRRRRARAAFTLIELMIVVCIIGVLASIAIPSFAAYMKKAKATEVPTNIGLIFKGMAVYWEAPKSGQGLGSTTAGHCPVNDDGFMGGPMPPFPPGPEPRTADWASGHGYAEVGFMPSTPVYAVYAWGHAPANDPEPLYGANPCGLTEADLNDPILNVIWGATDLDGDGLIGGFTVQTTLRGDQLAREPGFGTIDSAFLALGMGACPMCAADFID